MIKKYELIGCCGMSCSLCPRFHTNGKSKCLGCGPDPHCQYCATFKCCTIKNNLESCADCSQFLCDKINNLKDWKGFDTNKIWLSHLKQIKESNYCDWNKSQLDKKKYLEEALTKYDSGRSKSFIILHFLFFNLQLVKEVMENGEEINEPDIKQRSKEFKNLLKRTAEENGIKVAK
jgi:hypothetical protein